jgi:hypothetical protein
MAHEPPIPEQNQSPYPIPEAPHHSSSQPAPRVAKDDSDGAMLEELPGLSGRTIVGIGAAITLGVAATIGALLFAQKRAPAEARARRKPAQSRKSATGARQTRPRTSPRKPTAKS